MVSVATFGIDRHGGPLVATLTGHEGEVTSIAYSFDGRLLASGSDDGTVRIWNTRTGEEAMAPLRSNEGQIKSIAFSPDGQHIVMGGEGNAVHVWDVMTGCAALPPLRGHSDVIRSVAFSPDGSLIASASDDKTVRLWSAETGQEVSVISDHTGLVRAVSFSPDGQLLASASSDKTVRFWRPHTWDEAESPLIDLDVGFTSVCFSPDSRYLATGSEGGIIELWDMVTREQSPVFISLNFSVNSLAFSPDGSKLFSAGRERVQSWDPLTGRELHGSSLSSHVGWIRSVALSPNGLFIASGGDDCTVRIWDTISGVEDVVQPQQARNGHVIQMATTSAGTFMASMSYDLSFRIWDAITGEAKFPPFLGHSDLLYAVAFSLDGCLIASASSDHTIRLWDAKTGELVGEPLQDHEDGVIAVEFSPDSRRLASGSRDNTVRVWDIATRQVMPFGLLHCGDVVCAVAFSPDGRLLAAGAGTGAMIHFWLSGSDQQLEARTPLQTRDHDDRINTIVFSPDSRRVLSGTLLGSVSVWDIDSGRQVFQVEGSDHRVFAYSPNGRYIFGASRLPYRNTKPGLWDAETGAVVSALFGQSDWLYKAIFTLDGRSIISGGDDCTIHIWDAEAAVSLPLQAEHDPLARLGSTPVDDDGWLVGSSGELLLWLPADYRSYIQLPPCSTVIGSPRVVLEADEGLHWGDQWAACWRNSARTMAGTSL